MTLATHIPATSSDLIDSEPTSCDSHDPSMDASHTSLPECGTKFAPLFHVSITKLVTLFVITHGLYQLYWFYQNWQGIKKHYDIEAWPAVRAFFSIFFTHSLFTYINEYLKGKGRQYPWNPSLCATFYVVVLITGAVLRNISVTSAEAILLMAILTVFLPLLALWPIYRAQQAINLAIEGDEFKRNSRLTWANMIWVVLGSIYWGFILLGLVLLAMEWTVA